LDVRVFGSKFANGAEVFFGQGIAIVSPPRVNPQFIDVRIKISETAIIGPRNVFVFNPNGESAISPSGAFVVGIPGPQTPGGKTRLNDWMLYDLQ